MKPYWILVLGKSDVPIFGMSYRAKNMFDMKNFCFEYGQMVVMMLLFVCCVGVICSSLALTCQMSDDGTIIHKVE